MLLNCWCSNIYHATTQHGACICTISRRQPRSEDFTYSNDDRKPANMRPGKNTPTPNLESYNEYLPLHKNETVTNARPLLSFYQAKMLSITVSQPDEQALCIFSSRQHLLHIKRGICIIPQACLKCLAA